MAHDNHVESGALEAYARELEEAPDELKAAWHAYEGTGSFRAFKAGWDGRSTDE